MGDEPAKSLERYAAQWKANVSWREQNCVLSSWSWKGEYKELLSSTLTLLYSLWEPLSMSWASCWGLHSLTGCSTEPGSGAVDLYHWFPSELSCFLMLLPLQIYFRVKQSKEQHFADSGRLLNPAVCGRMSTTSGLSPRKAALPSPLAFQVWTVLPPCSVF